MKFFFKKSTRTVSWVGLTLLASWSVSAQDYRVLQGDSLFGIARKYNVTLNALASENNIQPPYIIRPGDVLRIPSAQSSPPPAASVAQTHRVAKGETLYAISRKYNLTVAELAAHNAIQEPYMIRENQVLSIPGRVASGSASKPPAAPPSSAAPPSQGAVVPKDGSTSLTRPRVVFGWPLRGNILFPYGPAANGRDFSDGVIIAATQNQPVRASEAGTVIFSGQGPANYGNLVIIRHADDWVTVYGHNSTNRVTVNQVVTKGQEIALAGRTGNATQPQLFFQVRRGQSTFNPIVYLR